MAAPGANDRLVVIGVGLPARGKTYISRKIVRFLKWSGYEATTFNVSNYRRAKVGSYKDASFFDPENTEAVSQLREVTRAALADMLDWFEEGGQIGVYDDSNYSRASREMLVDQIRDSLPDVPILFVEVVCDSPEIIDANIREMNFSSPDYAGFEEPEQVLNDFRERLKYFESVYETLDDPDQSYVKVKDMGKQITLNRANGYLTGRIVFFLMNLHTKPRTIYMSRHGQSEYNVKKLIGGDSRLSDKGREYAVGLSKHMIENDIDNVVVFTSKLVRTRETASYLVNTDGTRKETQQWRELNEINAGDCDGMTYKEIDEKMPQEFAARQADKFRYRYPNGESYEDLIIRLTPVIMEVERQEGDVLIVGHQAILRVMYAYFMGMPPSQCPTLPIPLHTVIKLTPKAYGTTEERFFVGPA